MQLFLVPQVQYTLQGSRCEAGRLNVVVTVLCKQGDLHAHVYNQSNVNVMIAGVGSGHLKCQGHPSTSTGNVEQGAVQRLFRLLTYGGTYTTSQSNPVKSSLLYLVI